jgi:hypothetical protein
MIKYIMVRIFLDLNDNDLCNNPYIYDEEQLIYTLQNYCPSLRILNNYQKLSAYICAKYIIFGGNNEEYGDCSEDRWLDDNDILRKQTHITCKELSEAHIFVADEEEREMKELKMMFMEDFRLKSN